MINNTCFTSSEIKRRTELWPNYLVIGAAKAATSTLCNDLGRHPDIFMVECKEPFFFNHDPHYFGRGWSWYESLYESGAGTKLRGEGTNAYTMKEVYPHTVERIARSLPGARLIYIARDPLPRIESWWIQKRANGDHTISADFNLAVRNNPEVLVDSTNYLSQIDAYREFFPDEQILVIFFEEYVSNREATLRRCFDHLGVNADAWVDSKSDHLNPSDGKLVYSGTLTRIRSMPGARQLLRPVPQTLKTRVRDLLFRQRITNRPCWTAETTQFVLDRIGSDCRRFLARYGKPSTLWTLEG
jgi:hypothetical protein